ncbi:MAG: ROK family transcriptional regulator [Pleurocapsa minor GSE-CHR-MK-17-07R]|jgi:predicted NBD/HSP70 family sugar kinase|nr:ROK family transcriptional regulator [Pleurocapsa minor GSE-CHR-MK 17-07R]
MRNSIPGNRDLIKAMNRNLLLNILRREGRLSRTQLTEVSGLSVGAVSQITTELIEENWVFESGEGDYTGGRRQVFLRLNADAGYALGLKLMETRVVCAITSFEAAVLYYQEFPLGSDHSPAGIARALADIVDAAINAAGLPRKSFFGVGVGVAGVINPHEGVVHYSPFFGWRDVPLAGMLQQHLGLPVTIENDVNTLTLSEHLFGAGRHQRNFIVITVGRGVGMGMVLHGQLYQGERGGAGELGHNIIDLERARRSVELGSIETLASDPAILAAMAADGLPAGTLNDVVQAAANGSAVAREALRRSGELVGVALAGVVNILAPSLVIISGEGVTAGDFRLGPMLEALRRYTFNGLLDHVEVIVEAADDRAWARGAATLVLNRVFASPLMHVEPLV